MNKTEIYEEIQELEGRAKDQYLKRKAIPWEFIMDHLNEQDQIRYYDLMMTLADLSKEELQKGLQVNID